MIKLSFSQINLIKKLNINNTIYTCLDSGATNAVVDSLLELQKQRELNTYFYKSFLETNLLLKRADTIIFEKNKVIADYAFISKEDEISKNILKDNIKVLQKKLKIEKTKKILTSIFLPILGAFTGYGFAKL